MLSIAEYGRLKWIANILIGLFIWTQNVERRQPNDICKNQKTFIKSKNI